ncbi:MAG: DUF4153 domain-containing protein [Sphingobium sp.]
METMQAEARPWPLRAAILALLGGAGGVAIHALLDGAPAAIGLSTRHALATFVGIGLLAFGHAWGRGRLPRALAIGFVAGLVVSLVFLWNGTPTDDWSGGESWRIVAALLAVFVFVPMAQGGGEHPDGQRRFRAPPHWSPPGFLAWVKDNFDYAMVHEHAWTNLITTGLSVLFAGLFFLMLLLVGALFDLVHVSFLKEWLEEEAVIAGIWGAAIGGSTGVLRDHRRIISGLQAVAMTVLRLAAPVLAVALALFLLILPLTGLAPLWEATRSTTPILLCAVVIALILSNSVIGNGREGKSPAFILRAAAFVLALVNAPLALIAAISTGLRVGQYGWTPERLWAATFILIACLVALTYLVSIVASRGRWAEGLRAANLQLAFLIFAVAFLLSTPLIRFDIVAARDQLGRLADGRTPAGKFDYRALWFDFGPAGRAAVRHLAVSGATPEIRRDARLVQGAASRWSPDPAREARRRGQELDARLTILPAAVALPPALREALARYDMCGSEGDCTLRYITGSDVATVAHQPPARCKGCSPNVGVLILTRDVWKRPGAPAPVPDAAMSASRAAAVRAGRVEVRIEPYRRVYVDGQPIDDPFPVENPAQVRTAP